MNMKRSLNKKTKAKNKRDIIYGDVDIPAEAFEPQNVKARISLMVRGDILDAFRQRAEKAGIGYQLLMQQALAAYLDRDHAVEERLERIEKKLFKQHG